MKLNIIRILVFVVVIFVIYLIVNIFYKDVAYMEDLTNCSVEDLQEYSSSHSLNLNIRYVYSNEESGCILSQSIKPGQTISKNQNLSIEISMGNLSNSVFKEKKVNELGYIPVMVYKNIVNINSNDTGFTGGNVSIDGQSRTLEAFISDLEFYYDEGYRMITFEDLLTGDIDVELGKSPIILSFDGGNISDIKVIDYINGELIIDPSSAIYILEEFKKEFPNYNITASFLIDEKKFHQPLYDDIILKYLNENGYEVIYHNSTFIKEVSYKELVISEEYGYQESPFEINFNLSEIKRLKAWDNNGEDLDIENAFEELREKRYISDGNSNTVVFPLEYLENYNIKSGLKMLTY